MDKMNGPCTVSGMESAATTFVTRGSACLIVISIIR
jgi:hypothetical protein